MAESPASGRGNSGGRLVQLAIFAAAGGLTALGHAPFHLPLMTLAGLAVGLGLFSRLASPRSAFWAGEVFGTGYFLVALHWIVEPFFVDAARHGWMAPFALVLMTAGLALFWATAFAAAHALGRGAWGLVVTLTGAEMLRAYLFTGFPWATLSHVWVDGVAGQGAAWVGSHGLTLILLGAACALQALALRGRWMAFALAACLAALTHWPLPLPHPGSEAGRPVVRLVQPNAPQHQKWDPDYVPVFFGRAMAATSAAPRPDLVVWPETSVPVFLNNGMEVLAAMAEAGQGAPVFAGIQRFEERRLFNSAVLIAPDGTVAARYDKHHLVPFGEYLPFDGLLARIGLAGLATRAGSGYAAGPGPRLIDLGPLGRALPLICYEAVFAQDVNGAPARPDVLLHITNDAWFGRFSGPYQHLVQARMRAIEQGLPLLRAANTGITAAIDARGRITAALGLEQSGHIDVRLPAPNPPTVYARSGDLPLAVLLCALGVLGAVSRRRKPIDGDSLGA